MRFLSLFFFFALLAPGHAAPPLAELYEARTFAATDGQTLNYRLLKPPGIRPDTKYPLVIVLHGSGERGTDNAAQLKYGADAFAKDEARQKYPAFVVMPQCPPNEKWANIDWTNPKPKQADTVSGPSGRLLEALAALQKEFPVDADRLYLTGLSMGGYGCWDLVTRYPERWAAVAPICGGGDPSYAAKAKDVPIWIFHGLADPTVNPQRSIDMYQALRAAGGHPLFSEYPGVRHESWPIAYAEPEFLPWLFAQKRGQPQVPFERIAEPFAQPPSSEFPGAGPVQPEHWFRALWHDRRLAWSESAAADHGAVVFFGDSITQGWGTLADDFPKLHVVNRGISGDTTRGLRGRLEGDVLALQPAAVVLLIGTNDLSLGATPELVAENLRTLVAALHQARPSMPIVLNKVMPRGARPGVFPEKIQQLNALYEAAFKNDALVTFCDTWSIFDDGSGQVKADEFPDHLHPNAAGYVKWTAALQPILAGLKLPARP